jgi:hypothetical protein
MYRSALSFWSPPPWRGRVRERGRTAGEDAHAVDSERAAPSPGRDAATRPRRGGGF